MTLARPDLADLELLVTIAEKGSIGAAAVALQLSQPSVSRRVSSLERTLHVPLLQRSTRGSMLTAEGRIVVDWATRLLLAADDFSRSVQSLQESSDRSVRAAVSMTIAEHYAPEWLAAIRRRAPAVTVALTVANSSRVAELVESGGVDIGFVESPSVRQGLRRRSIGCDELVVAVDPGHSWADRASISASEFARTRLLVRETGSGTRETIEQAFQAAGLELFTELELASNTALKAAAVAGMGPVVVSVRAVADDIARGRLVAVPVDGLTLSRPLSVVWRASGGVPAAARPLLEAAAAAAEEAPDVEGKPPSRGAARHCPVGG
jgi:DNA-binding transcriptional LysR family regulator